MVTLLLATQGIVCLGILYNEVLVKRASNLATSLFFVVYAVLYIVVPLILHLAFGGAQSIVKDQPQLIRDEAAYVYFNIYGLVLLSCSAAISFCGTNTPSVCTLPTNYPRHHDRVLAGLIISSVLIFAYSTQLDFGELLVASRFAWVTDNPVLIVLGVIAVYLNGLAPFYFFRVGSSRANRDMFVIAACIAALIAYGILTKDRKWIFYLISGWLAARYDREGRHIDLKPHHLAAAALLFVVIFVSNFARDALPAYFLGEDRDLVPDMTTWLSDYFQQGDLSYFYKATIEALHQNISNGFLVPLALLRRILFFALPTDYAAGLKVEDISAIFSDVVHGEDDLRRGSMPPGLFGLFAISFGAPGTILFMPLLAILLHKLDRLFRLGRGLLRDVPLAFYFVSLMYAFRGDESTAYYLPVVNLIALWMMGEVLATVYGRRPGQSVQQGRF